MNLIKESYFQKEQNLTHNLIWAKYLIMNSSVNVYVAVVLIEVSKRVIYI